MVEIIGLAGMLAFLVSSLTVGLRLLALGLRKHRSPELAIGAGFVIGGAVGYAPETVILSTDLFSADVEARVLLITQIAIRIAAVSALLFTLLVFRRRQPIAWLAGGAIVAGLIASWLAFPQTRVLASDATDRLWYDVFTVLRSGCIAWGSVESFAYYAKLRRRAKIGIGDPVLTNRFLLWGIGLLSMTLLMATTLLAAAVGVDPAAFGWVLLESTAGLIGAATLWLTFFPGVRYVAMLQRRADTARA